MLELLVLLKMITHRGLLEITHIPEFIIRNLIIEVNYYTISCDVVPVGLSFNGNNKQVIGRILIGPVDPGEQIVSSPIHPYSIDITTLKNQIIPSITFWMQDDKGRDVDTLGEFYSFRLRVVTEL